MNRSKVKNISRIAMNVLLYLFLAICIFSVFFTMFSKKSVDGATEILGYQMRVVTSESMAKCDLTDVSDYKIKDIPLRSMVFVKVIPDDPAKADEFYGDLQVGDVLTFRYVYTTQITITHRITSIKEKESGGYIIELAGDNKSSEDGQLTQIIDTSVPNSTNYVIGKVTGQSKLLGGAMNILKQPAGIIFLIILPCAIIMLIEILKIMKLLTADKKIRDQKEMQEKENEIEELRRRIAEMENEKIATAEATAEVTAEVTAEATDEVTAEATAEVTADTSSEITEDAQDKEDVTE